MLSVMFFSAAVKLSPYDTSAFGIFDRIVKQYRHKLYYTVTVAAEPDAFFDVLFNHYAFEGGGSINAPTVSSAAVLLSNSHLGSLLSFHPFGPSTADSA